MEPSSTHALSDSGNFNSGCLLSIVYSLHTVRVDIRQTEGPAIDRCEYIALLTAKVETQHMYSTSLGSSRRSSLSSDSPVFTDPPNLKSRDAPRAKVVSAPVDGSRPPMMVLPPPPKQPPPPAGFLQRATSPAFGSGLSVPNRNVFGTRQHGSSMPPSQTGTRQPPSTSSFRSTINNATYSQQSIAGPSARRKRVSSSSLGSSRLSSLSSDNHIFMNSSNLQHRRTGSVGQPSDGETTDPILTHAITQTMIGEFFYKYRRKMIGKGYGERRHKRFFWVHPYAKMLYWSSADPRSSSAAASSAKSGQCDVGYKVKHLTFSSSIH